MGQGDAKWNEMANRLMIALDYPDVAGARTLIDKLEGIPCYMKVGMQLFYAAGPEFINELKSRGYSVFADVKMHDIPNTVKGGAESLTNLGVDMFNVHAAGGSAMMAAAREGAASVVNANAALKMPLIIAVTQLTSTSQEVMNNEIGIAGDVADTVVRYAKLAAAAGLDGVVASPQESSAIAEACGPAFCTVTPGIRPAGASLGDQSRVMTPGKAIQQGSHFLVVGRPVTTAADPRQAALNIIEEMTLA
ncbi:orotidine-5'-phosphate decarboxylase [Paenibacillus sp. FSL R5-0636]|uniref:orotidine-5'-phosphate decarboxylase n=1 Tax=Paenibacillus TaxID=44249 RepID=UPI00096DF390|nr:orotidine-5'-phosphate decarboxylase [Paenibacillus odorifer]OMC76483.1 orotidine 5'-phosphate decarboxylase [Paenibacillus odorifer]OMC96279.1 orotidine 5'-phosphate decarboxylase [Paenibacillus odorifer]OMD94775.1 orotidine 5'-phosphate decarboxylase [Paenibacillus odorifer]OME02042.1 orotidine 5'-phosphate decarboxylase [Paenibacillus odorifer]OME06297.1 orotidine 5'-phosphate decarboxylase [Paenibacillus odorifer]